MAERDDVRRAATGRPRSHVRAIGPFEITADQDTSDRWDDVDIPHVLGQDYFLFVGILDEPPQLDDGIDRQLGLIVSEGNENDAPFGEGAGHLGSSGVYFAQAALDPENFGDGWVPMTGFDTSEGFNRVDTGASAFLEFGNTATAILVPTDEVGDSILSGLIFGRLTEGEPANNRQPATTRTVTILDPFGGRVPPLPDPGPGGDCQPDASTGCLFGRFALTGMVGGEPAGLERGDEEDELKVLLEQLEIQMKILNGCGINNHFWVFAAAATDVEYTLTVTDTATGSSRAYGSNPFLGQPAEPITDTLAFATCP